MHASVSRDLFKVALSQSWDSPHSILFICTLLALIAPTLYYYLDRKKMDAQINAKPFPFMELPPELRDMVYDYLVEDPCYPPPAKSAPDTGSSFNWMMPMKWPSVATAEEKEKKKSNFIFLANKQLHAEYIDVLCKKATFHLTVSPSNYTAPPQPLSDAPFPPQTMTERMADGTIRSYYVTPPQPADTPPIPWQQKKIWKIADDTLRKLRRCDIKLISASSMLGTLDPRNMKPSEWALARQIRGELKEVKHVHEMNLHVKAIGDPLWNPLWIWYHASQNLKTMGGGEGDESVSCGPTLNRITFSLDIWSPGENYLMRDPENKNQWAWWCDKGHHVGVDSGVEMPVREFCAKMYAECRTCKPLDSDDEEEDDE